MHVFLSGDVVDVNVDYSYVIVHNYVPLLQYLFPDAGVEKSSENDKTKAAHSNASGTAGQQGNSDDVCLRFFMTI